MLHGSSNEPSLSSRRSSVYESHSEVPFSSVVTREPLQTVIPGVAATRNPQDASLRNRTSSQVSCDNTTVPNVEDDTLTVDAIQVPSGVSVRTTYGHLRVIGTGSFGVVYIATLTNNGEQEVAIKKVLQDDRYKNRELQILKELSHVNVVALYYYFYSVSSSKPDETYLNLVQEFVPQTLNRLVKHYWRIRQVIPLALVKLYSFQLLRGLAYIHSRQVCHRDIKPQNLLINPEQGVLKICDFGSAKILSPEESNVSYICSRYYRAPELIFGATQYTVLVDMWSAGCVIGELLLGRPLFPGGSGVDQLVEIIKVLGTPTPEQIFEMNPQYSEFKFPNISGCPWEKVIRHRTTDSAFSVLRSLLVYSPKERMSAANILADCFFADLIFPPPGHPPYATGHLPSGKPAPQFPAEFTESELDYLPSELVSRIRECKDAVAEVALRASIQADSPSDASGAQRFGRVRSHISRDDLPSSTTLHSARSTGFTRKKSSLSDRSDINGGPSSKALMTTSVIDSRTRIASLSTLRLSDSIEGKLVDHPKTNVHRSSSHLTQSVIEESDADPVTRLPSKPRTLLNRHNLRGKPANKPSHTRHW